jgi:hypothetical protein
VSRTQLERCRTAYAAALIGLAVTCTDAAAGWVQIADPDGTDMATNPGYPGSQSPTAIGNYLKDLLNLAAAPTWRHEDVADGAGLAGIGDPTDHDTFLLALHFGNNVDVWPHTGPYEVFFSCTDGCDTFALGSTEIGNYRLYSVLGNPVERIDVTAAAIPEPATLALLGLGFAAVCVARRRRAPVPVVNAPWKDTLSDEVAPLRASVNAIASIDRAR